MPSVQHASQFQYISPEPWPAFQVKWLAATSELEASQRSSYSMTSMGKKLVPVVVDDHPSPSTPYQSSCTATPVLRMLVMRLPPDPSNGLSMM